jgi:hypothetical protein
MRHGEIRSLWNTEVASWHVIISTVLLAFLGFSADEAVHLVVPADLLIQLQKALTAPGVTQAKAAKILPARNAATSE